jgi:hypothetical protein
LQQTVSAAQEVIFENCTGGIVLNNPLLLVCLAIG